MQGLALAPPPPPNLFPGPSLATSQPSFLPFPEEDDDDDEDDVDDPTGRERVETALADNNSSAAVTR